MASKRLAIFTLAMLVGCGGGGSDHAAADSLSRDLQRLPVDSTATFADTATPAAEPVAQPVAVRPKPQPKPKPKPAAPKPAPLPRLLPRLRRSWSPRAPCWPPRSTPRSARR